jgi:hypothetical protein
MDTLVLQQVVALQTADLKENHEKTLASSYFIPVGRRVRILPA